MISNGLLNKKVNFLSYVVYVGFVIIILRLSYLQINLTPYFIAQSEKNFLRTETIHSQRGNILDRSGKLLATNRPVINIFWQGSGNQQLTPAQLEALHTIDMLIPRATQDNSLFNNLPVYQERHCLEKQIAWDVTLKQLGQIEELLPNNPNIVIKTGFKRLYPYQHCASHIIGYLGHSMDIDLCGKMGLEKMCEQLLKGKNGALVKTINSVGKKLNQQETSSSLTGQHLQTTIDINLQQLCEKVFLEEYTGTFILMQPDSGDIVALVSKPNFDPNIFMYPIDSHSWNNLQEKKPFLNRAFNACYPPGSIFKLVTASAALENNIICVDSEWDCRGYIRFAHRNIWCHNKNGHGRLTTTESLAHSCNILCYEIGKLIDIDTLAHYAHIFGLGSKTNVLFPENVGLVPTREWKQQEKGERWWPGETLSACIGQSFLLVTPIQVACMIASIFTGKIPTPRMLMMEPIQNRPLKLKQDTVNFLKRSMKRVVTTGTGKLVNHVKNFEIYAKTSTAQTSDLSKRTMGIQYMEHSWFVSHIKYKNSDPLVAVILVENAGSSRVPTAVAKNFLIEYARLVDGQTDIQSNT